MVISRSKNRINYFFQNITPFKNGLPTKEWLKLCLSKENRKIGCINVIFCSDTYLNKLNKEHLNNSDLTDVISFKYADADLLDIDHLDFVFGDIFISVDRVRENKNLYNAIFAEELKRVMIHGALHLIGYNDKSKKDKLLMTEKENLYLKLT